MQKGTTKGQQRGPACYLVVVPRPRGAGRDPAARCTAGPQPTPRGRSTTTGTSDTLHNHTHDNFRATFTPHSHTRGDNYFIRTIQTTFTLQPHSHHPYLIHTTLTSFIQLSKQTSLQGQGGGKQPPTRTPDRRHNTQQKTQMKSENRGFVEHLGPKMSRH